MAEIRLGDIIDDFCVKCKRLTNHAVVSIMNGAAAKVRCRTCYSDHDYRNEQAPPSKRDLQKAALFAEVLKGVAGPGSTAAEPTADLPPVELTPLDSPDGAAAAAATPAKPKKIRKKA
jgi:hypothetical protein